MLRSDESEGREYYEFRFQLLSPYKFDEDMDAGRMNQMLKSFRSNNKELIKETNDEVFSRFLSRLSIWYAADRMDEDEEENADIAETEEVKKESTVAKSKSTDLLNRSNKGIKEPKKGSSKTP